MNFEYSDNLFVPIKANKDNFKNLLNCICNRFARYSEMPADEYINGIYSPTPTIIEAAISLYNNHNVEDITKNDASVINLNQTSNYLYQTIEYANKNNKKVICFVTGVPGAGKTLVGLNVVSNQINRGSDNLCVFLSGNKPLVDVLTEALARDKVLQEKLQGIRKTKKDAQREVKAFIQIVHHYRDAYIENPSPPVEHIAIFDEAQRAWSKEQTKKFMAEKKGKLNFEYSEPEFLVSCLERHQDWAVIICLVGGGQEINTGEAGIAEWLRTIRDNYSNWETRISPSLIASEYVAKETIEAMNSKVIFNDYLHLSVSMRSFRAENLSKLIKEILDLDISAAETFNKLSNLFPIVLTRNIEKAKSWLKQKSRGNERYGLLVSSKANRLKPLGIDVRIDINHVDWFLGNKSDVRSSYFLEDVATEFQVQGLELDWTCVVWDADLRFCNNQWGYFSFSGNKWSKINIDSKRKYLLNAYRVLLTRARQGMVIVLPEGNLEDSTRLPEFYDSTYDYFASLGINTI